MSGKTKVILDVDTGSDDAIAIMAALSSPALDVLGITTVNGNQPVPNTTENTLRVIDLMKSDIPVYRGCEEPLVAGLIKERQSCRMAPGSTVVEGEVVEYHSEYLPLPPSVSKVQPMGAVRWMIDTLMYSNREITIIAVGPLTNLAVALRAEPRIASKIKEVIIMGGGYRETNKTSAAEFNIWKDPESAQIVVASGMNILLVPLDATHQAYVGEKESNAFRELGTPVGIAVADLLDQRIKAYDVLQPIKNAPRGTTPPHDALAVCAAIDRSVLTDVEFRRVDVDFGGSWADGMTVVDQRVLNDFPKNVNIALGADREKFSAMLYEIIASAQ